MGRSRYKIHEEQYPYFLTSSIVEGIPLFANPEIANFILKAIEFNQKNRDVEVNAYVIMENHMHLIAKGNNLAEHIRNLKAYTSHQIIEYLKRNKHLRILAQLKQAKLNHKTESEYQFWQEGSHPKQIFTHEMMIQKIEYIHFNPVKRGYVEDPVHWRYSSAKNYAGLEGLVPVTLFKG